MALVLPHSTSNYGLNMFTAMSIVQSSLNEAQCLYMLLKSTELHLTVTRWRSLLEFIKIMFKKYEILSMILLISSIMYRIPSILEPHIIIEIVHISSRLNCKISIENISFSLFQMDSIVECKRNY